MEPTALDTLVGAPRWRTFRPERCVLVVVHNVTALTRLLEVLPLLSGDPRVQLGYTCTGSSAFQRGTIDSLLANGMRYVPWDTAVRLRFDLAISASYGGDLHELSSPLLTVPHGMGYNIIQSKTETETETETENRQAVFGLSREWLTHGGTVVPSLIVLSHDEQLARLRAACPDAAPAAVVTGDIVFDRLLASRPLRESYRDSLGVRPGQRLVVVSSTWGPRSLLGTRPDLARALALHCPVDEYRIALAAHPNVWHGHSPWQVREWLAETERAGVVLLPRDGWKSALVAADVVVGDYGSVTYYGAALARPVLLASAPEDVVAPTHRSRVCCPWHRGSTPPSPAHWRRPSTTTIPTSTANSPRWRRVSPVGRRNCCAEPSTARWTWPSPRRTPRSRRSPSSRPWRVARERAWWL